MANMADQPEVQDDDKSKVVEGQESANSYEEYTQKKPMSAYKNIENVTKDNIGSGMVVGI
ncbi:hypothetical protein H3C67_01435 [Candidatus Dojkabacteria bacterium]|uniref:Uncharacterized protein n=1 Tax=Candidatus Dojkabacteria bacterium TaxID=2099670 RepID=A0A952AL99_9BACT|nr:hypothetical protein [Candidatus Dojkabacteria bacterium]